MGCGILFPRDYMSEVDMCENLSLAAINDEGDYHSSDSEDDEDDEWVDLESGTKVQVCTLLDSVTIINTTRVHMLSLKKLGTKPVSFGRVT